MRRIAGYVVVLSGGRGRERAESSMALPLAHTLSPLLLSLSLSLLSPDT
jgi:hypothetical protein